MKMLTMEPVVKFHDLIDLSTSRAAIADILEGIDEDFLWLDEILTECKNTFSTATLNLLPKTPSQKKPPRKRVKRRLTEELENLETISESAKDAVQEPPTSTSDTPVRRLRSARSRITQASTSSRVTRNSKTASRKTTEEKEDDATELRKNNGKTVKVTLASVSESRESPAKSPKPSTLVSTLLDSKNEEKKYGVRDRARAYESMLSERVHGSPVTPNSVSKDASKEDSKETPKNAGKETPNSSGRRIPKTDDNESEPVSQTEIKPAECEDEDPDIVDTSQRSQSFTTSRRSSKRISLKVLGSKARMRSLQGRLSVNGPCASFMRQTALESQRELAAKQQSLILQVQTTEPETVPQAEPEGEPQKNEERETKGRAPRTRLRLNKSNKSATDSAESSASDCAIEMDKQKHEETDKEAKPVQTSTRTKRRKQKSLSSDDEAPEAKIVKESACTNNETEVRTRTRTKMRNKETAASETKEGNVSQKTESDHLPVEAVASNKNESVTSNNESRTRTRTKARNMESKETTSSMDTISSDYAVDIEGTEESVFESPVPVTKPGTRSSERLSDCLSAKSGSTTDSGIGPSTKSTGDNDNIQETAMTQSALASSFKPVKADSVAETNSKAALQKAEEVSRRETRVISRAELVLSEKEEEAGPSRSTRTKTRQEHNKSKDTDAVVKVQEQAEEPRMTRTKTRKRKAEEEAADISASKRSCIESPPKADQHMDVVEVQEADDDSDYEDIEPDPPKRTVPSFLNQLKKNSLSRSTNLVSSMVTSFLKGKTPPRKPNFQHLQEQKKKELLQKEKREQERLNRLDTIKKNKAEEQKRKREERMRKAAEMREMRQQKEHDLKKNLAEKLKERLNSTEKMKEDKFKEEREKQRLRLKRQLVADERRRQEEEQRLKKLIEQQEEQKRQEELLQRKKEQEDQERHRRQAEERKRQEERLAEAQRQRQAEQERLRQQELEREREQQKEKEQKEKTAAQERAERVRQEMEKRKERELKIQRDLERLKEMEQQRLARMAAEEEEKRREETRLQQVIQQHNRDLQKIGLNSTLTLTSTTIVPPTKAPSKAQINADSYPITPARQKKNGSMENYDINDLKSDDSTDDDENPRKKIPKWAQGANLKAHLINQVYHPPDLDAIFAPIAPPDLNEMFDRKRARFNKRTSSAVWNSPMHKPH